MPVHHHGSKMEILCGSLAAIISDIYAVLNGYIDFKNILNAAIIAFVTGTVGALAGAFAKYLISKFKRK